MAIIPSNNENNDKKLHACDKIKSILSYIKDGLAIVATFSLCLSIFLILRYSIKENIPIPFSSFNQITVLFILTVIFIGLTIIFLFMSTLIIWIPYEWVYYVRYQTKISLLLIIYTFIWIFIILMHFLIFISIKLEDLFFYLIFSASTGTIIMGAISLFRYNRLKYSLPYMSMAPFICFLIMIWTGQDLAIIKHTLEILQIRSTSNKHITLTPSGIVLVKEHARITDVNIDFCKFGTNTIIQNATILWRFPGGPTILRLTDPLAEKNFTISINEDKVDLIQTNTTINFDRCLKS